MRTRAAVLIGFLAAWALALGQTCPTVCVIIPEEDRCVVPRPVPDPACETAIIRAFLSYGFNVHGLKAEQLLEPVWGKERYCWPGWRSERR